MTLPQWLMGSSLFTGSSVWLVMTHLEPSRPCRWNCSKSWKASVFWESPCSNLRGRYSGGGTLFPVQGRHHSLPACSKHWGGAAGGLWFMWGAWPGYSKGNAWLCPGTRSSCLVWPQSINYLPSELSRTHSYRPVVNRTAFSSPGEPVFLPPHWSLCTRFSTGPPG